MSAIVYLGSLLVFIGSIWLVVISIQVGQSTLEKVLWAIVNLICQPVGGIVFFAVKRAGLVPLLLIIAGCVMMGIGYPSMMRGMMGTIPA